MIGGHFFKRAFATVAGGCACGAAWWNYPSHCEPEDLVLKRVVCIFRHGARTPVSIDQFPGLEWVAWDKEKYRIKDEDRVPQIAPHMIDDPTAPSPPFAAHLQKPLPGGCLAGELTTTGRQQAIELGQLLRSRYMVYSFFLSKQFSPEEVYVRSTNYPRTLETARGVLFGLYGPSVASPIPIATQPEDTETLFPNPRICQQLRILLKSNFNKLKHLDELQKAEQMVADRLGVAASDINMVKLRDMIACMQVHGIQLPRVIDQQMVTAANELGMLTLHIMAGHKFGESALLLSAGPLVRNMCEAVSGALDPDSKRKMILFSAHDTSVLALMGALDPDHDAWPPFCSHVIMEVLQGKESKQHFVRMTHDGHPLVLRGVPSSNLAMPLDKFLEHFAEYNHWGSAEYEKACKVPNKST